MVPQIFDDFSDACTSLSSAARHGYFTRVRRYRGIALLLLEVPQSVLLHPALVLHFHLAFPCLKLIL
jgi:hypothetical protein